MKKLIWILILAGAAYFAYNYFSKSRSAEEGAVRELERAYAHAEDRYITALRESGGPGFEIITDPETAARKIQELRYKLRELMKSLKEEKAIARAQTLEERIVQFCKKNEID